MAERTVDISSPPVVLRGDLTRPLNSRGLVLFAHGSGSSRLSTRNRRVATALNERGLATLLFDLLITDEEADRAKVFDVELLSERLLAATRWATADPDTAGLPIGYFGASTGAAAALSAAAELGEGIRAVVSRGGRPDMAGECLRRVSAPTLLIVGGADRQVLALNEQAAVLLRCPHEIEVVAGATPPLRGARCARAGRRDGGRLVYGAAVRDSMMSLLAVLPLSRASSARRAPLAQAARINTTGSAHDVSLFWLSLYGIGSGVWLCFGATIGSIALIASQARALASVAPREAPAAIRWSPKPNRHEAASPVRR